MFDDQKRKIVVEKKSEMKVRIGESPDLADAAAICVHLARELGSGSLKKQLQHDKEWEELSLKYDSVYNPDSMYAES